MSFLSDKRNCPFKAGVRRAGFHCIFFSNETSHSSELPKVESWTSRANKDCLNFIRSRHSRPQKPCSSWSAPRFAISGKIRVSEHAQSNLFVISASQICQTLLWACAEWRKVFESRTSGVRLSQRSRFLASTKRTRPRVYFQKLFTVNSPDKFRTCRLQHIKRLLCSLVSTRFINSLKAWKNHI